jgi:CHAT domain-containing protein
MEIGDYDRALPKLERSVVLADEGGLVEPGAHMRSALARLYCLLGDYVPAHAHAQRALLLALASANVNAEWVARWILGLIADATDRPEDAVTEWKLALVAAEKYGATVGITTMNTDIASGLIALGRAGEARPFGLAARGSLERGEAPALWWANIYSIEAQIAFAEGRFGDAAAGFGRAAETPSHRTRVQAMHGRAMSLRRAGDNAGALATYQELIRTVEAVRERTPDDQRANFLARHTAAYRELISLLWEMEGPAAAERAFAVAEAARARSLLDALHAAGLAPRAVPAVSSGEVRARLRPGELLVEYVATENRLLALALTHDEIRFVELPGAGHADALAERVSFYRRLIEQVNDPAEAAPAGRSLHEDILAPLLTRGIDTVIVSVDGALAYLPFDALVDSEGRFVAETLTVLYVASASLLQETSAAAGVASLVAIADPPRRAPLPALPFSRDEASAAVDLAGARARLLSGGDATEAAVKRETSRYGVLHFATHAVVDEVLPLRSALVLGSGEGEDGLLMASEIYRLVLPGAVVVLSGCRTGSAARARRACRARSTTRGHEA